MTVQEARHLFAFNAWATNKFFDALAPLPQEQLSKDMQTSHKSIHATFVHFVGAEKNWCSRWTGTTVEPFLTEVGVPTLAALKQIWTRVGFDTAKFLGGLTEKKLQEFVEMKTAKGEVLKLLCWQSMMHVVDHCSYHRGQIVTMMRQQGLVPPSTGMIGFFLESAKLGSSKG